MPAPRRSADRHRLPLPHYDHIDAYLAIFKELARKTAGIRRPGAAALDLAYVACGRFDGFWEFGLSPWDIAGRRAADPRPAA
jgi:myo-inositol-1(or 4)-monophosphatase